MNGMIAMQHVGDDVTTLQTIRKRGVIVDILRAINGSEDGAIIYKVHLHESDEYKYYCAESVFPSGCK